MALVEGVKYGLSATDNNNGTGSFCSAKTQSANQTHSGGTSKSVIFVKLTDSAFKAIEDYLRSQHKTGQHPATLKFLGNEGSINIPSSEGSKQQFDFSLSSNADIEGPQGSFECIQQCGSSSLKSMGTVPFKLRIHAKDDVYETTRQRMKALEETRKDDCCAKEIKPNGADIGRRVKKKLPRSSIPPPMSQYQNNRQPSPNYNSYNNHLKSQVNKPINGYNPPPFHHSSTNNHATGNQPLNNHANNGFIRNPTNALNPNTSQKPNGNGGGSINKRPLRDRLIHLLALKPYKKPELISRINRDGTSEKDKKLLMPLLSQVTTLRNNEYVLNRGIWNDIQEDWPFYSEQERQTMKRRKPQNLTPPGSDCSVGSGGSLSSLSPRSSVSNNSGQSPPGYSAKSLGHNEPFHLPGAKRPPGMDFDLEGGDNAKRQRISHFKRPSSSSTAQHHTNSIPSATSREKDYPYHSPSSLPNRFAPNGHQNHPTERLSPSMPYGLAQNGHHRNGPADIGLSPQSYEYPAYPWHGTKPMDQSGYEEGIKLPDSDETDSIDSGNGGSSCSSGSGKSDYTNGSLAGNYSGVGKATPDPIDSPSTNGYSHGSTVVAMTMKEEPETYDPRGEYVPQSCQPVKVKEEEPSRSSKEVKNRGKEHRSREKEAKKEAKLEKSRERLAVISDSPKYLTSFLPIHTPEQRNRYKAEFNSDYKEYMRLHSVIDKVSKLFAHLDERLRQAEHGSHDYNVVKDRIIQEYASSKANPEYEAARRKFQYLHGKLSHIKRLVLEYDSSHSNSDYGSQVEENE